MGNPVSKESPTAAHILREAQAAAAAKYGATFDGDGEAQATLEDALSAGFTVLTDAHYVALFGPQLLDFLGSGGGGAVFLASKMTALKFMKGATRASLAQASQELLLMARVSHRNIVGPTGLYVVDTRPAPLFLQAMPYVDGTDMELAPDFTTELQFWSAARQLFEAVAHLHSVGVVHRDIVGRNIMYCDDTCRTHPPGTVVLIDFGLARIVNQAEARRLGNALMENEPVWLIDDIADPALTGYRGKPLPAEDYGLLYSSDVWNCAVALLRMCGLSNKTSEIVEVKELVHFMGITPRRPRSHLYFMQNFRVSFHVALFFYRTMMVPAEQRLTAAKAAELCKAMAAKGDTGSLVSK